MRIINLSLLALCGTVIVPATLDILEAKRIEIPPDRSLNLARRDLPEGTCNGATPCPNGACCGDNGLCGYSPLECGPGCASNCNAKAECGEYAAAGKQKCPLSVCCSSFGFCGSTSDFCRDGCQEDYGSCGDAPDPPCGGTRVEERKIAYYESWADARLCQAVQPEELDLTGYTSINFAFAYFSDTYDVMPMDAASGEMYSRFTAVKKRFPGLQTWISIGGWTFNDPGPTRNAFSSMASSTQNRRKFIRSLLKFINTYGFDGLDLDWEYPQAEDRGGQADDADNLVILAQELSRSLRLQKKGLSLTIPTSYWYLRHFDVKQLQDHVDWFNLMSYDLHGTWDKGKILATHTNLTEIQTALDLLWRAGVDRNRVVLGTAFYGRSFRLKDPSCSTPNGKCLFEGDADPGICSNASGILNYQEIQDIISEQNLEPISDKRSATKWITWNTNQWVSYDDDETWKRKKDFAVTNCLGGIMVWAIDQKQQPASTPEEQDVDKNLEEAFGLTPDQAAVAGQLIKDQGASLGCLISECNLDCFSGTSPVALMRGQPKQLPLSDKCEKNEYRSLCCFDGTDMRNCQWRGWDANGKSCVAGCKEGETELATDSNIFNGEKDQSCTGGFQSFCCEYFKPTPDIAQLLPVAAEFVDDQAKAAAIDKAFDEGVDQAAKAICKVGVPIVLNLAKRIPIVGNVVAAITKVFRLDLAKLCASELADLFHFTVNVPNLPVFKEPATTVKKPPQTRPPINPQRPLSTHVCPKRDGKPCPREGDPTYTEVKSRTIYPAPVHRVCKPQWSQACYNAESVIKHNPQFSTLLCPTAKPEGNAARPAVASWSDQHNMDWRDGWMQASGLGCQVDEVPGAAWMQDEDDDRSQWVRYVPGKQNNGAGALWKLDICRFVDKRDKDRPGSRLPYHRENLTPDGVLKVLGINRPRTKFNGVTTQNALVIDFPVAAPPDWGIQENPCWPSNVVDDPGFALLLDDVYYDQHLAERKYGKRNYKDPMAADLLTTVHNEGYSSSAGFKLIDNKPAFDPDALIFNDGNSSRRATNEELRAIGIVKCSSSDCGAEMQELGIESAAIVQGTHAATVEATPSAEATPAGLGEVLVTAASPGSPASGASSQATAV
ncbi:unnamed protein product [Zymoseptoria tritici ST99CH_1E4]|uniref:chitinase n=1 Tax=Zymoseptoria tritici ST99CH_1E4 TaxID=1276532 RepID=A0A2H1GPX6_ZYMTR|nr:unnamed protein product [Zymoseptoria tritici ST99CH_1E4]